MFTYMMSVKYTVMVFAQNNSPTFISLFRAESLTIKGAIFATHFVKNWQPWRNWALCTDKSDRCVLTDNFNLELYPEILLYYRPSLSRGGSLSGGSLSGGLCQGHPPYGYVWTVLILLECILVSDMNSGKSVTVTHYLWVKTSLVNLRGH